MFVFMCMCVCQFGHINAVPTKARSVNDLELGLQVVVNHKMWVLGTDHTPTARAVHALNL